MEVSSFQVEVTQILNKTTGALLREGDTVRMGDRLDAGVLPQTQGVHPRPQPGKSVPGPPTKVTPLIEVVDLKKMGVDLEVPLRTCAIGHKLLVNFRIFGGSLRMESRFEAGARVEETENLGEGRERISLFFTQVDPTAWEKVLGQSLEQQQKAYDLFRKIKGF